MKVVKVGKFPSEAQQDISMKTVFDDSVVEGGRTLFGTVTIPPGGRVPLEGTGSHERDEYSIIIKGSILTMSNGQTRRVSAGEAIFIPCGETHWAHNDGKDSCDIVWALVRR